MRYGFEWTPGIVLLGAVVVFPLVPPFAMIALVVVAVLAIAALVALAGVILASPYLLVRAIRHRLEARRGIAATRAAHATPTPPRCCPVARCSLLGAPPRAVLWRTRTFTTPSPEPGALRAD